MALAQPIDQAEPIEEALRPALRRVTTLPQAQPRAATEAAAWHAFQLLHWAFVVLPIVAGAYKFFDALGPWQTSAAPLFSDLLGVSLRSLTYAVGAAECVLGILVAFNPRIGGWLVAAWLWGIVVTQLLGPGYVDVALRDAALSLGALALARLAAQFDA
jgi:hypothetical protein